MVDRLVFRGKLHCSPMCKQISENLRNAMVTDKRLP